MTMARDVMTKDVVVVSPDRPSREIATLLLDHAISAVPVVDAAGVPIGMVSEGDLIGRGEADREARRDWWLKLMAEADKIDPTLVQNLRDRHQTARDIMSAPVVTVAETTDTGAIAHLLSTYRIKRVPVVRDGRIVGIVSRADILRAYAAEHAQAAGTDGAHGLGIGALSAAIARLDERFFGHSFAQPSAAPSVAPPPAAGASFSVADLRALVADAENRKAEHEDAARRALAEQRRLRTRQLIAEHVADPNWQRLLHLAREAAERGEREVMLLRFPSEALSDGGRAINVAAPDWPATLKGEAAELYLRWAHELRPRGFHLTARILDFPGGMPGDVGLFLVWGD